MATSRISAASHCLLQVILRTFLGVLLAAANLPSKAATHEILRAFGLSPRYPSSNVVLGPDGYLWGTTEIGGTYNYGTIYKVKPDGSDWATVYSFNDANQGPISPSAGLMSDGQGYLWGTCYYGGRDYLGAVYKFHVASGTLTTVYSFTNTAAPYNGRYPAVTLVADGSGFIWGTTTDSAPQHLGTIFKINMATGAFTPVTEYAPSTALAPDGQGFLWGATASTIFKVNISTGATVTVASLTTANGGDSSALVNDGQGFMWGAGHGGGANSKGTLFKVSIATGAVTKVLDFTGSGASNRGAAPGDTLVPDGLGFLWGTTSAGGYNPTIGGTVYKVNIATGVLTTIYEFPDDAAPYGATPDCPLVNDGNGFMYGTTGTGGDAGLGSFFKVNIATGELTTLVQFADFDLNNKGRKPQSALAADANGNLWGTTNDGGRYSRGTVYKLNPSSGVVSTVIEFSDDGLTNDGAYPLAGLTADQNGIFWGTTSKGGYGNQAGFGTLYQLDPATDVFSTMVRFGGFSAPLGSKPLADLLPDGNGFLWGSTSLLGASGDGNLFKIQASSGTFATVSNVHGAAAGLVPDGQGYFWGTTPPGSSIFKVDPTTGVFTKVIDFNTPTAPGGSSLGRLVSDGNGYLWGTTSLGGGGNNHSGTIFKVNVATGAFTQLVAFTDKALPYLGAEPKAGLTNDGVGNFWGTTSSGGTFDFGTIFKIRIADGSFTTVVNLTGPGPGANSGSDPWAELFRHVDGCLYGTTFDGGPNGGGTLFRIRLGPTVTTLDATAVGVSSATLHSSINPGGYSTAVAYEWGTDPTLATSSVLNAGATSSGTSITPNNVLLSGLLPNTTYYFRARGQNAENSVPQRGQILSFTTPANTPPVLTLKGANPLTFQAAATYTDPGATGSDVDDGSLSPTIIDNTVASKVPGTYTVTWKVTDSVGAIVTATRTVNVVDTVAPGLTVSTNMLVEATGANGATVNYPNAVATDIVGVTSLIYSQESGTVFPIDVTTVQVTAKDAANNTTTKSFTVTVRDTTAPTLDGTFTPLTLVAGTPLPDYTLQATSTDAVSTPILSQSPAPMSPTHGGTQHVTITATDQAGNHRSTTFDVTISQAPVTATTPYVSGSPVPGAGLDPRIPSGATWIGFGPPAINASGQVAYIGKWAGGSGIFVDDTLVLKAGETTAGVTFKSFKDPVLDDGGHVAFIATLAGVPATSDSVVAGNGHTGALEILAREGDIAPDTGGAKFKAFSNVSIEGTAVGVTVFTGTLAVHTGTPTTTGASDTGAWWQPAGGPVSKLIREGDPGFDSSEKIKSFQLLLPLGGSPGQGRGQASPSSALLQAAFTNKQQAQLLAANSSLTDLARTGDVLGGPSVIGHLPDAQWSTMSLPSSNRAGSDIAVLGVLKSGVAGITVPTAKGIFVSADSGATWDPLARVGISAPTLGLSVFSLLKDPVHSSTDAGVAFLATVKGGGAKATTNDAIWWRPANGALGVLVREGNHSSILPASATWKSFPSLAYAGGTGPLFTALLGGVKSIEDCGLYVVDSFGDMRELMRENQPLVDHTVKSFTTLTAVPGSAGASRSFSTNGQVTALVTFVGGTTAIAKFHVP